MHPDTVFEPQMQAMTAERFRKNNIVHLHDHTEKTADVGHARLTLTIPNDRRCQVRRRWLPPCGILSGTVAPGTTGKPKP
jgi:hypothetical protein